MWVVDSVGVCGESVAFITVVGVVVVVVFVFVGCGLCVGASSLGVGLSGVGVGVAAAVGVAGSLEGAFECSTCSLWASSCPGA